MKPKTKVRSRLSIIMMAVTVVAVVPAFVMIRSRVRYLAQLEAPTQYNHPYAGRVDERVMPVAEVRALCTSVGASGAFVACAWVSDGVCHIILPSVPLWSLYADRLELENDGQRISYRPTPDEIALIPIPGRRKAVSDFAIGS